MQQKLEISENIKMLKIYGKHDLKMRLQKNKTEFSGANIEQITSFT